MMKANIGAFAKPRKESLGADWPFRVGQAEIRPNPDVYVDPGTSSCGPQLRCSGYVYPLQLIFFIPLATGPLEESQPPERRNNAYCN